MADYSKAGPVATLAAAAMAPLVLSLAPSELVALSAGTGLVCALVRMTFIDGDVSVDAKEREARAAHDVIFTSSGNRAVRIALGMVYLYAAATLALRWMDASMLVRLLDSDVAAVCTASTVWSVCVVDGYFAGIWLTSGANGE